MKKTKITKEPSEVILNFNERQKRSVEIQRRLAEAYPMIGGSGEDSLWRSLTTNQDRDLNLLTQRRMQDIAFYLYDSNPMAGRIIEIIEDFVIGDGFSYTAQDPDVKEVLDNFWEDPDNNLDEEMNVNVVELFLFGELCLPVWVNSANGAVKLGYIDPKTILKIKKAPNNPKINQKLIWRKPSGSVEREINIINVDKALKSKTYGRLVGDCFYFTINKVSSATRGRSALLRLADWLDGYDSFLFARLERAFLLNNFIWDIQCEGMNKGELEEFVKTLATPRPGSIRAHNEKITWKAETPKLESADASDEARLFKQQILGGSGYPEHWFGEGSTTTRACMDSLTETLTENGWKKYWEVLPNEKIATLNPKNNQLEYHLPVQKFVYDIKNEELIYFNNKFIDIMVTPEHKMWTREKYEKKYKKIMAKDLEKNQYHFQMAVDWIGLEKQYFNLPSCPTIGRAIYPELTILMDDFLEFLGYFISEGSLRRTQLIRHVYTIEISQKDKKKTQKIRECLNRLPFKFSEKKDKDIINRFNLNDKALWIWLYENVGNLFLNKKIPLIFKNLGKRQLRILLDALILGDGSLNRDKTYPTYYYTASEKLRDDFQEIALKCGFQVKYMKGNRCWRLALCQRKEAKIWNPSGIKKVKYQGKVYCFEVPNHLFITRRNGKIGIHSNTAKEMSAPVLKSLKSKQKKVKFIIKRMFNFVIDQAIIAGTLTKDVNRNFKIIPSPIVSGDSSKGAAEAMGGLIGGLVQASDKGWISDKKAKTVLNAVISQLGVDMESDTDEEKVEKEETIK